VLTDPLLLCAQNQFKPSETPHECGYFIQPNGNIYHGDWYYGKRHGWGISVMSNGRVYEGGFRNDKRSGWGVFRWPGGQNAGDTYVGGMCGAVAICLQAIASRISHLGSIIITTTQRPIAIAAVFRMERQ
jgi:hypothetical protein